MASPAGPEPTTPGFAIDLVDHTDAVDPAATGHAIGAAGDAFEAAVAAANPGGADIDVGLDAVESDAIETDADVVEAEVVTVLLAVPELAPYYLQLVEDADGDPGAAACFGALAEFLADLLVDVVRHRAVIERCLGAVETVATTSVDADELVTWSFIDALTPGARAVLAPLMGPATRALALGPDGPGLH